MLLKITIHFTIVCGMIYQKLTIIISFTEGDTYYSGMRFLNYGGMSQNFARFFNDLYKNVQIIISRSNSLQFQQIKGAL